MWKSLITTVSECNNCDYNDTELGSRSLKIVSQNRAVRKPVVFATSPAFSNSFSQILVCSLKLSSA